MTWEMYSKFSDAMIIHTIYSKRRFLSLCSCTKSPSAERFLAIFAQSNGSGPPSCFSLRGAGAFTVSRRRRAKRSSLSLSRVGISTRPEKKRMDSLLFPFSLAHQVDQRSIEFDNPFVESILVFKVHRCSDGLQGMIVVWNNSASAIVTELRRDGALAYGNSNPSL